MPTARRHRRFAAALALLAMLALVLLPTLSQALSRAAGNGTAGFAEVCTPQGVKWLAIADGEQAPAPAELHLEHCPYCTAAADLAVLPSAPAMPVALPAGALSEPALFLQSPRTLFAWTSANPRAPPAIS